MLLFVYIRSRFFVKKKEVVPVWRDACYGFYQALLFELSPSGLVELFCVELGRLASRWGKYVERNNAIGVLCVTMKVLHLIKFI